MNKKPWVAFFLSFLLPGAGLAYLGMWLWGLLNLVVVMASGLALAAFVTDPSIVSAVGAGLCAGSAVMAKNLAARMNMKPAPSSMVASTAVVASTSTSRGPATLMEIPAAPAKPGAVKCAKCGTANEGGNFCVECGSPL